MRTLLPLLPLLLTACYDEAHLDEVEGKLDGMQETLDGLPAADEWEYSSICFYVSETGCKMSNGDEVGDYRIDCIDDDDFHACVEDGLDDVGEDGWMVHLGDESYPSEHRGYLLSRAVE